MIASFRHRGLRIFFDTGSGRGLPTEQVPKIRRILTAIEEANEPADVGVFPGWRLHRLVGDLAGFWSVRVTGNLRIVFRFEDGDASDLDLLDYH